MYELIPYIEPKKVFMYELISYIEPKKVFMYELISYIEPYMSVKHRFMIGRPELEGQLSVIVSQYRRLLSTCIVRAHAQCLISRIGVISPQAREAARRREVAGRVERQLKEERRANWMASLRGPGSARGGRCHMLM